jgi:hypothetical protein
LAVGQINSGLYFSRSQQYLSVASGIFTLFGILVILALSVMIFIDIFNYKNIQAKIEYKQFNIEMFNQPLYDFLEKTRLKFKVKAYNFWDLQNEPLICHEFLTKLDYLVPNGELISMNVACEENNEALNFNVEIDGNDRYKELLIENY